MLRVDIQLLEGPVIGDTSGLLNVLLANNVQVLEGRDVSDITSLLNMLLVERSFRSTIRCLGSPSSAILHWHQTKPLLRSWCGGFPKVCVLVEWKARHRVKSEQWQLKPVWIRCLSSTSVHSWMKSMVTICSFRKSLYRDLSLYEDHKIRRATNSDPTLL